MTTIATIEEFNRTVREEFRSAYWFKTSLEQTNLDAAPRFRVCVIAEQNGAPLSGEATNPRDAINRCKSKIAQEHEDKIEAAKLYLAANGHTIS